MDLELIYPITNFLWTAFSAGASNTIQEKVKDVLGKPIFNKLQTSAQTNTQEEFKQEVEKVVKDYPELIQELKQLIEQQNQRNQVATVNITIGDIQAGQDVNIGNITQGN